MSCSPYFNLNLTTQEMEAQLLSMGDLFDLQNDSAKRYDQVFLNRSLTTLNALIDIVKANSGLYNYPMLVDRLNVGPISPTEYADFLIATGTSQTSVESINNTYMPYSSNTVSFIDGAVSTDSTDGRDLCSGAIIVGSVPSTVSNTTYSAETYFSAVIPEPTLDDGIISSDTGLIWKYTGSTEPGNINGFVNTGCSILNTSELNPESIDYLTVPAAQYLENMNTYYTDNFASDITGGICSLYTTFNAWLNEFKANLNILLGLLSIETIIKQLINTIKEQILSIINQLVGQINACLGSINSVIDLVKDVKYFFSDDGIKNITDTVSIVIADIGSKFEVPQTQTDPIAIVTQELEAVNYLLYRLCQFATAIEDFMMAPVTAIQNAIANCEQVGTTLTNISNQFTFDALTAGAFRMSDSNIDAVKTMLGSQLNNNPAAAATATATGADGSATPSNYWTTPFTPEEISMAAELKSATPEQIKAGSTSAQKYLQFQSQVIDQGDPYPCAGVKELQPSIIIVAVRISKRIGKKLIINSGYRSPAYNAKQPGSAKNSYHMKGLAMDCARSAYGTDFISGENFIKAASQEGVGGVGTYPTFIHIDTGPRRTWSTIGGTSLGHDNARSLHQQDKFRNGL